MEIILFLNEKLNFGLPSKLFKNYKKTPPKNSYGLTILIDILDKVQIFTTQKLNLSYKDCDCINPFQTSVAFHIETSHLICYVNEYRNANDYRKYNADLKWVKLTSSLKALMFRFLGL